MTPEEIQALAQRIADFLAARRGGATPAPDVQAAAKARSPDIQGREGVGRYRPAYAQLTVAARAAAAGSGPSPLPGGPSTAQRQGTAERSVPVAISNRHIHLSQSDVERLFGSSHRLTPDRSIKQPGQFAAQERLRVVGPKGAIAGIRVVGPARGATQVELAASDAYCIGLDAPIRASGSTGGSAPVRLEGPAGAIDLSGGAIIAARHLHVSIPDGSRLGLSHGERVTLLVGSGDRRATLHEVLVRSGEGHATELHVDTDEARAFGIEQGSTAVLVGKAGGGHHTAGPGGRQVITERDVDAFAAAGRSLSRGPGRVVTPAAIDRAKAFGIWRE